MLTKILQEIKEMKYQYADGTNTDIGLAASCGFAEAKERIAKIVRNYIENDGWIYCGNGNNLPDEYWTKGDVFAMSERVQVTVHACDTEEIFVSDDNTCNGEWSTFYGDYKVLAWKPLPQPYRQKSLGEDYKQQIMERFLKVE